MKEERENAEMQTQLELEGKERRTMTCQLNDLREQLEQKETETATLQEHLRMEEERATEVKSQLERNEQEMMTVRQENTIFQEEGKQLRREHQQQINEWQSQLRANEQEIRTTRQQNASLQGDAERLRREHQQRENELQSQMRANEQELQTLRQQNASLRGDGERLRGEHQQQVNELQRQLRANEQEMRTMRQQNTCLRGDGERLRGENQQRVNELQSQMRANELEIRTLRMQLRDTQQRGIERPLPYQSSDWVIKRSEIQMTSEQLGQGAWAIVYKGKFRGLDVAVKEMHEDIYSSYNRHLFEREVNFASKCRHPCLLLFIGATIDQRPLLVTEIMEKSLRSRLYDGGERPMCTAEISVISLDVARALNYLHQKEPPIIHHDVSSGNVLLWRRGNQWRGKVSDYGTANFVRQSKTSYAGAAIYAAPESLDGVPNQPLSCKVQFEQLTSPTKYQTY